MSVQQQTTAVLGDATVEELRRQVRGAVIQHGDPEYDSARQLWNGRIDKHPALIVRCAGAGDVIQAVLFARSHDLEVAVRGGGHSAIGLSLSDGGLVIDLSRMKGIRVDPMKRTARAEAGLLLGEFIQETQLFGLATTTGIVSHTGLSGLTLGGGMGWLAGKYGLTIDNLLAVDVITADGEMVAASAMEHPDLFWAIRGGGGNFGVVTSFELQLHPVGPVLAGMVVHPLMRAKEVLRFYRDFIHDCPDELTVRAGIITTPDGHPAIGLIPVYSGDLAKGERVLAPLRRFASPVMDAVHPMSYLESISMLDAMNPRGWKYSQRANSLLELSDGAIDVIVEYGAKRTSLRSVALVEHFHGAAARIDRGATAFARRHEHLSVDGIAVWTEGPSEQHIAWSHAFADNMKPFAEAGLYVNFLGDEGQERVRASYGSNYSRLAAIKRHYDPTNFFHLNQNIVPAPADGEKVEA
jgi:FAD/FMN-containing dehydrogenase